MAPTPKLVCAFLITGGETVRSPRIGIFEIDREEIRSGIHTVEINGKKQPCTEEIIFDLMGWHEHELKRFLGKTELNDEEKERCKGYYNREKSDVLEYDVNTHCIHIKSMFKYALQVKLIKGPKGIAAAVYKTLKLYKHKVPGFFAEFRKKYDEELQDAYKKLCPKGDEEVYKSGRAALKELFSLKNHPFCKPKKK